MIQRAPIFLRQPPTPTRQVNLPTSQEIDGKRVQKLDADWRHLGEGILVNVLQQRRLRGDGEGGSVAELIIIRELAIRRVGFFLGVHLPNE